MTSLFNAIECALEDWEALLKSADDRLTVTTVIGLLVVNRDGIIEVMFAG